MYSKLHQGTSTIRVAEQKEKYYMKLSSPAAQGSCGVWLLILVNWEAIGGIEAKGKCDVMFRSFWLLSQE